MDATKNLGSGVVIIDGEKQVKPYFNTYKIPIYCYIQAIVKPLA